MNAPNKDCRGARLASSGYHGCLTRHDITKLFGWSSTYGNLSATYQRLLEHLSLHFATDSWAESLLEELQQEAKPAYLLPSGVEEEYRVN